MSLTDREVADRLARVDALLDGVESLPDPESTIEVLQALLDLYGEALARIVAIGGERLGPALAQDELVSYLLVLHDLHPLDVSARVEKAVSGVRPRLGGAAVETVAVADGVASVRLLRGRGGCGTADRAALLEEAIRNAAPELDRVEIEEIGPPPVLISIDALRRNPGARTS
ncbi:MULTISPECIES: NifU family protein [unclassified Nonomuraea]|uniref:NifU family protein n=1 Tax=unclassified Nonomuraea TaxID=2593643 RepID=UPI0033CF56C0